MIYPYMNKIIFFCRNKIKFLCCILLMQMIIKSTSILVINSFTQ